MILISIFYCYFEISQIFKRLDSIWYKITDSHIFDTRNLIRSVPLKATFTEGMWKYDHYLRVQSLSYNSQNFRKIQRSLPPDKHTYVYVSGGKKCQFLVKFFVILKLIRVLVADTKNFLYYFRISLLIIFNLALEYSDGE